MEKNNDLENLPVVSICCTTFNHASYIKDCLDGILMQETTFDFEVLIYDDASTDGTSEIIEAYQEKYPKKIFPICSKENNFSKGVRGMSFVYNIPRAKGKYLALCEGDDYWTAKDKLQRQVEFMEKNPDIVFTFHNFRRKEGDSLKNPFLYPPSFNKDVYVLKFKEAFNTQIQPLTMLFRKVISKPKELNVLNGDALLIALLLEKGKGAFLNFTGAVYRIHDGGIHAGKHKYTRISNSIASREKMLKYFDYPVKGELYLKLAHYYKRLAKLDFKRGHFFKGMNHLNWLLKYSFYYITRK
ncbi:glycosyltransferase family 2 protein [Cyclobacterium marinum]|uniref:Glycosyl transferase family 2 n=1 Tax=Cyclobacterium marinum (strain ATCC 25205 / DSM 745 / LMG 13164 / NCIMB 1802) TaxID=880070 RepID=G0J659_CYCMS|nr:glycosyltransferase [Cyclobacterium marinum]AEL26811.1 glycosyl transferase family 2 [Cyclobacterium marinum DSM 745]